MKVSKKRTAQLMVFAIALLLVLALSIGISSAFYQAKRQASGTVTMNQGIKIDYQGFSGNATPQIWEKGANVLLFSLTDAQPGQEITVNASSIKANAESVDFYARVKLTYAFYNDETPVTLENPSALIKTSTSFFGANWVESSTDGYYYYGASSTLHKFDQTTGFVTLIENGAKFIIEGENFIGAENEGQGGGFVVENNISINKIEVTLTLETLQGSADAAAEGWTLTPITRVYLDKLADVDNIPAISIDDVITGDKDTRDNQVLLVGDPTQQITVTIGSRAFAGCPNLNLALSDSANIIYQIASDAFENSTGATIMYGLNNVSTQLINPSVSGKTAGIDNKWRVSTPNLYLFLPTGIQSVATEYGDYQYTDSQGTWYFDLIDESGRRVAPTSTSTSTSPMSARTLASTLASSNLTAKIKYVDNKSTLTTLTIPGRVGTSAGSEMFDVTVLGDYRNNSTYYSIIKNTTSVQTVVIPNSVTSIVYYAFYECYNLTSITIPDSVTSIGDYAFQNCSGLTSITIPDSVTSIRTSAFKGCSGLTSVTIGNGVTSIWSEAFNYCSGLETITVGSGNTKYKSAGNCLIETASKTLIRGCKTSVIPTDGSVTSIGDQAFEGSGLNGILTIPDSVKSIGYESFYACGRITSVTIGNNVTSIGSSAFNTCTGLTSITIPDSVTSIGDYAFSVCSGLTTIDIGAGVTNVRWLEDTVTNVTISPNNENLASDRKAIFAKKSGNVLELSKYRSTETTYEIPSKLTLNGDDWNVTGIGAYAFEDCSSLTSITIPDGVTYIGGYAFERTNLTSIAIPGSVTQIGYGAFLWCYELTSITIPNSVTSIGGSAFNGCRSLTSVTIGNGVTSIGYSAFNGCRGLTSITIPDGVTSIEGSAFKNCTNLQTAVLPEGITSVPYDCFSGCTSLTTVTIPSTVTSIESRAFENCTNLTNVIWNVTYDFNGVTATAQQKVQLNGNTTNGLTMSAPLQAAPTNLESGLTFEGWTDGTTTYPAGSTYTFTMTNRALKAVYNKYVITFDANGGEGSVERQIIEKGSSMTLPSVTGFTKEGYKAIGWSENPTATSGYVSGGSYKPTINTKFYIVWAEPEKSTITITFDLNGGEGTAPASVVVYSGVSVYITLPTEEDLAGVTREGYRALGWSTYSTATSANYSFGSNYYVNSTESQNKTLYIVWKKLPTITFNLNGGEGTAPASQAVNSGTSITLPTAEELAGVTREEYIAIGWATYSTATYVSYTFGSSYTVYSDTTLYIVWKKTVTITFDSDGGTGTLDSIIGYEGQSITLPTEQQINDLEITRGGDKAIGFATYSGATYASYAFGANYTIGSTDTTLYIAWKKLVTITFDLNGGTGTVPAPKTAYYGEPITLPTEQELNDAGVTKDGFKASGFTRYQDSDYQDYSLGANYYVYSGDVTFYIFWGKLITVSFDVSAAETMGIQGIETPDSVISYYGDNFSLPLIEGVEIGGYKVGWSTDPSYGIAIKNFGEEFTPLGNKNATLYLTYQIECTITFDKNGGTGEDLESIKAYLWDEIRIPSVALTKTDATGINYTFLGWSVSSDNTNVVYKNGYAGSFKFNKDITLYAVWASPVNISFDLNDGRTTNESAFAEISEVSYGTQFTIPSEVPTKDGYTFDGWLVLGSWYETSEYSVTKFGTDKLGQTLTSQFISGNCKLVAYWVKNEQPSPSDGLEYLYEYGYLNKYMMDSYFGSILSLTPDQLNYLGYLCYINRLNSNAFKPYTNNEYTLYNSKNEIVESIGEYEMAESVSQGETYTIKFNTADAKVGLYLCGADELVFVEILDPTYNEETDTWDIIIDHHMIIGIVWVLFPGEIDGFPRYDSNTNYTCWAFWSLSS